jgi:hypothetical protein
MAAFPCAASSNAKGHRGDRLMAKVPGCVKTFAGLWRIVWMDVLGQRLPRSRRRKRI